MKLVTLKQNVQQTSCTVWWYSTITAQEWMDIQAISNL